MDVVPSLPKGRVRVYVVPSLPKGRVRVWMFYQAYQRVGYSTAACTRTRTRPRVFLQDRTRYQGIFRRECRTYQSVGYEYGCCTKLTKVSSMVRRLLVPVPVPDPFYFNKAVSDTRLFCRRRTELTKVSGTGMDVVPNLPRGRVRVGMLYQAYQRVGFGYRCRTKLTKVSGTGMDVLPSLPKGRVWYSYLYPYPYPAPGISTRPYPVPGYSPTGVQNLPKSRVRVWKSHQAYQSVGYG